MDTNAWYEFIDQNGERHVSRGDNGYIQQSYNQGIPIYVNDQGEWFTEPYLELTPDGYVSHIPAWFKNTDEYERWNSEFVPQMDTTSATKEVWEGFRDTLKSLGTQGALRIETYNTAESAGITDPEEKKKAYEDYLAIILEGAGQGNAQLDVLEDAGTTASVAEIARKYKSLSKEDLSDQMTGLLNIINAKGKGKWNQKTTREALTLYKLLNLVADNPDSYGQNKEFEGLLEASEQQKFNAHVNSALQTTAEGMPLFTWIARGVAAAGKGITGKGPGFKIEDYRNNGLYDRYSGQNLRGVEGSIVSGNVVGSIENIGATIGESMIFGKFLDAKIAVGAPGSLLAKIGTFSKTFGGSMVYDWFAHDLPIDLSLFATDRASGMSAGEAWYDESKTQPLFGLFGPEVPYGLAMNLAGDALMDLAIPILGVTGGAIWDSLDDISGGSLTKIRESVALKNLAAQEWISNTPVLGTGLRKFSDWLFTPETTSIIREGRKAAILKGSTSFYADAQNLVTLMNHYGAEVVAPMYKHLVDELNINEQIEKFVKNANKWGGVGQVKVEWDTAKSGVAKHFSETVTDDIPRDVKQGLLDYQRLEELKGEIAKEGGLISNPKKEKEIAMLEKKVEALDPQIKKFAEDVSNLNKRVEQMMVALGLTTQDWIDALNADPRWKNYMTRQVVVPGGSRGSGAYVPEKNKLLTGTRTGFYNADQTLSPIMSLDMKVHAIGVAYAWNERAKAIVGYQIIQGKVKAGAGNVDLAKKISEVRATIATQEAVAAKIGYDAIANGLSDRMVNIGSVVKKLNEKLGTLENISVKSAFNEAGTGPSPEIKGFKADFQSGKYTFADGVLVELDMSSADGASVIQNTYYFKEGVDVPTTKAEVPKTEVPKTEVPKTEVPKTEVPKTEVPTRSGDYQPTLTKEDFISKYGYDPRETINLGKIDTPEDAVTALKDMTDANGGFISQKDLDKVFNKFPELKKQSDEIITTLRAGYTRDDLITELYNRVVSDVQGTPRRVTVEVANLENITEPIKITNPILGQSKPEQFSQTMFHGSGKPKSEIYVGAQVPVLGEGTYWSFTEDGAKNFGDKIDTTSVTLERPLIISSDDEWRQLTKQAGWRFPSPLGVDEATMKTDTANLKKMVTDAGYDGIIVRVDKSTDGLLRDVFSIDQVVSYKPLEGAAEASEPMRKATVGRGISNGGVPFEFEIEDGAIVRMTPIATSEGLAESVNSFNQGITITAAEVEAFGAMNTHAINRAQMFCRDNGLIIPGRKTNIVAYDDVRGRPGYGSYGYSPYSPSLRVENGRVVGESDIRLNKKWYGKGQEEKLQKQLDYDVSTKFHPANSNKAEGTPFHEGIHDLMKWLAIQEYNADVARLGVSAAKLQELAETTSRTYVDLPDGSRKFISQLESDVAQKRISLEEDIVNRAMERMGYVNPSAVKRNEEISKYSRYARTRSTKKAVLAEAITEGFEDYIFNGNNAQELSRAIVAEVSDRLKKYQTVLNPQETLVKNGLDVPGKLTKDGQYAFPASVKTDAEKAKWLDGWRQKNPYLKGEFTEETFQKANLWDSYFQKEIRTYDAASDSTMPDLLVKKSGDFIETYKANLASEMVEEIKKLSVKEFDSDLAMMVMGRNGNDIAEAMDNFIIRQIETEAENVAKNMEGGATRENINVALITLWSDTKVQDSVVSMLNGLVPGGSIDVQSKVANLFDTQAKGLAAYEALPLDTKVLLDEKEKLLSQLRKENKGAMKAAEAMDKNSSFIDGGTHLIHYREGGEDVYVAVSDPVVASMLEKPYDWKETGMISETTASIANFVATTYRLGTTGMNPLALVRNILRDPIQAMVTGGFNPLSMSLSPEVFYKTLRQYGLDDETINMVTSRIKNWAKSSTMTQEMRLGPGKYNSTYNSKVDQINRKLRNVSNGKIINALQTPLETWEGFFRNQIGQQSFMKNLKRTGDVDKALGSALFDTSNVTTNFSHSIGKFKRATSTIPYLSSAINGTVSFWRLFNMDPIGMVTRITAGFMVPVMAITMWNLSSDENRKVYENLPEWYKQGHLVLVDPQGNVLAFPLPEEIQQFSGVARKLMEYTQEATPFSLGTIAAQGALGFLPFEVDGYFDDDGSINIGRGTGQLLSGIMPQAFTTIYELAAQEDLFTGQDLSNMQWWNQLINAGTNMLGTGFKNLVNSIGIMCGASEKDLIGKSFQDTLARDLFGMGFNEARDQFQALVGNPSKVNEDGSERKATGLFAKNEELQRKIKALDSKIATASDDEKAGIEEQKQNLINEFTTEVTNLMNNYQRLFQVTGGLEQWQKTRLVQVLTLGSSYSSAQSGTYQAASSDQAYLDERGLAIQRYIQAGLPSGPTMDNLAGTDSYDIQAAVNRFYGVNKQATQDFKNVVESSGMKDVKDEFYSVMQQIYDSADEQGKSPDYDLIERIQARYLQMMDAALVPIINQYGINVLNNNDFLDAVRRQVNGMIPSDDWRQSTKNAKKFLSTKEFPTATVDVKKWLKQRYSSGMKDRGLDSDQEVTDRLQSIRDDIDAGRLGSAKGKIESLKSGVQKANYYISAKDLADLNELYNMVK